jgi:hypothetical protein
MRRFVPRLLILLALWLHAAPLVQAAPELCGHCASRCCCRLPRAGGQPEAPRLSLPCPGSGAPEAAVPAAWPPALLPVIARLLAADPADPLPCGPPSEPRRLAPAPPTPPPRFA